MGEPFLLRTPRLLIRQIGMEDHVQILSAMSCPEIDFMHSSGFKSADDVQQYIAVLMREYEKGQHRTLAIARQENDMLIGSITLDRHKFFPRAEISYWIALPYRGMGYATEAVKAIIEYSIRTLHLNRIQATHHLQNSASARVLKKAGMVYEGTLRQYYQLNGTPIDEKMYSVISSDFL